MHVRALWRAAACGAALAALLASPVAAAQAPKAPSPPPCTSPEHRQFDFWVGDWSVNRPDGKLAGTNRVDVILGGCVVHESWRSANGKSVGQSFNIYAQDGKWHQTWVDNSGALLQLTGGLVDGRMVMSQRMTRPDGTSILHEISWEKLEGGKVKQHWRVSRDEGKTWTDAFVGIYSPKR
jgi:hypothetical protein